MSVTHPLHSATITFLLRHDNITFTITSNRFLRAFKKFLGKVLKMDVFPDFQQF